LKDLPKDAPSYQSTLFHAMFASDNSFDPRSRNRTFSMKLLNIVKSLTEAFENKIYTPESLKERKKTQLPMWILGGILFLSMAFVGASVVR
jgi:hypothetical protein